MAARGPPISRSLLSGRGRFGPAKTCRITRCPTRFRRPLPTRKKRRPTLLGFYICTKARRKAAFSASAAAVPELTIEESHHRLDSLDIIILDCDGVLWRAGREVPRAAEAVLKFREEGKRLVFLTNNSSKSRKACCDKLNSFGMSATPEEVITSGYAAARYLVDQGFERGSGKRCFVVGDRGLEEELEIAGVEHFGGTSFPDNSSRFDLAKFQTMEVDQPVDAVVVGFDGAFSYNKLAYATTCLLESPGCLFVCTNLDHGDNVAVADDKRRIMPGTGCLVQCLETGASRQAFNVGKGGGWILPYLVKQLGVGEPQRACLVGDRLDTDIATALAGGLQSFLPLSGVTSIDDVCGAPEEQRPDFYMPTLARLAGLE